MNLTLLLLTCANQAEAERISLALLEQNLIACSKMSSVHSFFKWEGVTQANDELLLIIETAHELCKRIEQVVRQMHSYDTFVMIGIPVTYVSPQAEQWLQDVLMQRESEQ